MARSVYSVHFGSFNLSDASFEYTVPAGYTAIVREMFALVTGNETGSTLFCTTVGSSSCWWYADAGDGFLQTHFQGRVVFDAGEVIQLQAGPAGTWLGRISGYLLSTD